MYLALDKDTQKIATYISFIREILSSGNETYKAIISEVIREAINLKITKDFYSVNRDRFGIISFLASNESILDNIDPNNLTEDTLEKLLSGIEKHNHTLAI